MVTILHRAYDDSPIISATFRHVTRDGSPNFDPNMVQEGLLVMMNSRFKMSAPPSTFGARRARLGKALKRPVVIFAGRARSRNYPANTYPFRAGSNYLYYGGPSMEGGAWVIEPGNDGESGCTLLRPPSSLDDAVWVGEAPSDHELAEVAGIPPQSVEDPENLKNLIDPAESAAFSPPCPVTRKEIADWGLLDPREDEILHIVDMRLQKDEYELAAMRRAADVSVAAHLAAMKAARPGTREADVAAAISATLLAHECYGSFTPGVSVRGEILHSNGYVNPLRVGDLLLVDAGAEEPGGYASDITRTFPIGGRFSSVQRALYEAVLNAQRAAIAECLPDRRYRDVHDRAALVLCEGLVEARVLRGKPADLAARGAHTLFFTHGVGHLIGLDVHDMEDFGDLAGYAPGRVRRKEFGSKFLRLDRDLTPGMTVTIEPGIYLVPAIWRRDDMTRPFRDVVNRSVVDSLLDSRFGGIRIEDTVHVCGDSDDGPEVLTAALPSDIAEVECILRSAG